MHKSLGKNCSEVFIKKDRSQDKRNVDDGENCLNFNIFSNNQTLVLYGMFNVLISLLIIV